jgi:hypothetical protein
VTVVVHVERPSVADSEAVVVPSFADVESVAVAVELCQMGLMSAVVLVVKAVVGRTEVDQVEVVEVVEVVAECQMDPKGVETVEAVGVEEDARDQEEDIEADWDQAALD